MQRPALARDGIFNAAGPGRPANRRRSGDRLAPPGPRADSLHRARRPGRALRDLGVVRVLDLRDERERDEDGVLVAEGIDVRHHPVLDPTFAWHDDDHPDPPTLLAIATS